MTTIHEVRQKLSDKGCKLISESYKSSEPIEYICRCQKHRRQLYRDFLRRNCRNCKIVENIAEKKKNINDSNSEEDYTDEKTGEVWKKIPGGWISSHGRAQNNNKKLMTLDTTKYRYNINGKAQYVTVLVATAFKIENYDKLDGKNFCVSHIDKDPVNNHVSNLIITSKTNIALENAKHSRQSEKFKSQFRREYSENIDIPVTNIDFIPEYEFFSNGDIYSNISNTFLTKSNNSKYEQILYKNQSYKVHRLMCFAFNKLDGKVNFSDYDDLQVNHKDGNTLNNSADNLEWVTQSSNINHAYQTGLNKKVRTVLQIDPETKNVIGEYVSIAEASRQTGDKEHQIREKAQGKNRSKGKYLWAFKYPEQSEEYSKKYSSS